MQLVADESLLRLSRRDIAQKHAVLHRVRLPIGATAAQRVIKLVVPYQRNVIGRHTRVRFKFRSQMIETILERWQRVFRTKPSPSAMRRHNKLGEIRQLYGIPCSRRALLRHHCLQHIRRSEMIPSTSEQAAHASSPGRSSSRESRETQLHAAKRHSQLGSHPAASRQTAKAPAAPSLHARKHVRARQS